MALMFFAGIVNGWQGSLASLLQSASFLIGILLPDPESYQWLMAGSWMVVLTAATTFTVWALVLRPFRKLEIGDAVREVIEVQPMHAEEGSS